MIKQKEFSKAKLFLQKELAKDTDNAYLLTQMANVLWNLNKNKEALTYALKAQKASADDPLTLFTMGRILWSMERYEESVDVWDELLRMDLVEMSSRGWGLRWAKSVANDALFYKADCLYGLGRKTEAEKTLETHLANRQKGLESDFSIKECRDLMRSLQLSKNTSKTLPKDGFASSRQLQSINVHLQELSLKKERAPLIKYLKRKCREYPNEYWLKTVLAEHLYHEGDKSCLKYAKEAFDIAPDDMLVVYNYAYSLYSNGIYSEAVAALNTIKVKGIEYIAYGEYGEGLRWAKRLMRDTEKLIETINNITCENTTLQD